MVVVVNGEDEGVADPELHSRVSNVGRSDEVEVERLRNLVPVVEPRTSSVVSRVVNVSVDDGLVRSGGDTSRRVGEPAFGDPSTVVEGVRVVRLSGPDGDDFGIASVVGNVSVVLEGQVRPVTDVELPVDLESGLGTGGSGNGTLQGVDHDGHQVGPFLSVKEIVKLHGADVLLEDGERPGEFGSSDTVLVVDVLELEVPVVDDFVV